MRARNDRENERHSLIEMKIAIDGILNKAMGNESPSAKAVPMCSFCNKPITKRDAVAGARAFICKSCADNAHRELAAV
jgi:hypothetical protein